MRSSLFIIICCAFTFSLNAQKKDSLIKTTTTTITDSVTQVRFTFGVDSYKDKFERIEIRSEQDSLINITYLVKNSNGQFQISRQRLLVGDRPKREWIYDRFNEFKLIRIDDYSINNTIIKSLFYNSSGKKYCEIEYDISGKALRKKYFKGTR